ncbi:MAG: hypothetical protein ACR2LV_05560 [Solirubrobacteraceae bacterium]
MSLHEPDGIAEVFDDTIRLAVTAGGRVAEARVRERQQRLRDAQVQSEQAARQLQARLESERSAARAELAPVHRDEWWEQASPEQIGHAWETAAAWRDLDPDAARAGERMRDELSDRYAVDVENLGSRAHPGLASGARARSRQGDAAGLMAAAHRDERTADRGETPDARSAAVPYDSAQRRQALGEQLAGSGIEPDAVEARVLADTSQACPPEEAVADPPRRVTRARRARGSATRREITRPDRGR